MDVSPTLAAGGNDAVVEPTRSPRRAASAPQVPPLRPDPEFMHSAVANDLVARFSAYQSDPVITSSGADLLRRAYAVAREAHASQKRASGEPYIDHPVAVAGLLLDLRLDVASVGAALLHDVVEDTLVTKELVEQAFGSEVAHLVDGVTKLSALEAQTKEEAQVGTYRKMFIAMADDPRVVLVKLSDRLHNMRTISAMKPESQKR
ncbi:MAG: HD domain-containing protein, partial [Roseiflexaceae bacterium]